MLIWSVGLVWLRCPNPRRSRKKKARVEEWWRCADKKGFGLTLSCVLFLQLYDVRRSKMPSLYWGKSSFGTDVKDHQLLKCLGLGHSGHETWCNWSVGSVVKRMLLFAKQIGNVTHRRFHVLVSFVVWINYDLHLMLCFSWQSDFAQYQSPAERWLIPKNVVTKSQRLPLSVINFSHYRLCCCLRSLAEFLFFSCCFRRILCYLLLLLLLLDTFSAVSLPYWLNWEISNLHKLNQIDVYCIFIVLKLIKYELTSSCDFFQNHSDVQIQIPPQGVFQIGLALPCHSAFWNWCKCGSKRWKEKNVASELAWNFVFFSQSKITLKYLPVWVWGFGCGEFSWVSFGFDSPIVEASTQCRGATCCCGYVLLSTQFLPDQRQSISVRMTRRSTLHVPSMFGAPLTV